MNEEWKSITDYEGMYEVSNLGHVRSVDRAVGARNGSVKHIRGQLLRRWLGSPPNNYYTVFLRNGKGGKSFKVSRLVAIAFVPNPHCLPSVDHVNCCKTDDSASNLNWVTQHENMQRASVNGLMRTRRGIENPKAKLNDIAVLQILKLFKLGNAKSAIAKQFNVGTTVVRGIIDGTRWSHVRRTE